MDALPDELLLGVLFLLDAPALGCLAVASRWLYAAVHSEDLWKALVLEVGQGQQATRRQAQAPCSGQPPGPGSSIAAAVAFQGAVLAVR